jgi:hypothetical protein
MVAYYGSTFDGETVVKYTRPQDINAGRHLALIGEAEFEQAQQIRAARGTAPQGEGRAEGDAGGKSAPRSAARVYVLGGLLDCARCGAPLNSQAGGGNTRRHVCSTRLQRKGACDQPSVKADALEAELAAQVAGMRLPAGWQEAVVGYLLAEGGLAALAAQRQALQEHFDFIKGLYDKGEVGRQVYLAERRAYERGLAALALDERAGVDLARALLADFGTLWSGLTPLEQRGIARSLLQAARVDSQHIVAWKWYPLFELLFVAKE